jgi:hypothetical protein
VREISSVIAHIASNASQQAEGVQSVSAASEELSGTATQINFANFPPSEGWRYESHAYLPKMVG